MAKENILALYQQHFVAKDHERLDLLQELATRYTIQSAIYPGSFVHITPAFVFPQTVYIDTDKRATKFFSSPDVLAFVAEHKIYDAEPSIRFYSQSYTEALDEQLESFDLLISQWAGFVSQHCTSYLKVGGLLLANNSHGDASMAALDEHYELVAVINRRKDKHFISEKNLDTYLLPKKELALSKTYLMQIGRGVAYTKSASMYLFQRIS